MQELGFFVPSFQDLCTDPCNMGLCVIALQREAMVVGSTGRNNGPQDLVTISPCVQHAITEMHLCSLFITHACCPSCDPTATMGRSIHNIDISKPLPDGPQSGGDPDEDDEDADELPRDGF